MKAYSIAGVFLLAAAQAWAAANVYDGFDYPAGQTLGDPSRPWTKGGSGADAVITYGSLSFFGLPASMGNSVTLTGSGSSNGVVDRTSPGGAGSYTSGTLYYSLILQVPDITGLATGGAFIAGFNNSLPTATDAVTRGVARLQIRATDSSGTAFNLGIRCDNYNGIVSAIGWDVAAFGPSTTPIFIVAAYTFNPDTGTDDVASLWINPTPGQPQPAPNATSTGSDMSPVQSFFLRQVDVGPNVTVVDELRIGTTWADVTPYVQCSAPTVTAIGPAVGSQGVLITGATIVGTNFSTGLTVKLTMPGQPDLLPTNVVVVDPMHLTCDLNLSAAAVGTWSVAVTACGSTAVLPDAFDVRPDNVFIIGGRKLFPVGFSPGPPVNGLTPTGGNALQELRDAGGTVFRLPRTGNWNDQVIADEQAALDAAAQHGMYSWLNLRELSVVAPGDTATEASLRDIVRRFKDHPGLGLWKNYDEAAWSGFPVDSMVHGYQIIKEEDPNHAVVQTFAPRLTVQQLQPYSACADILALDIYPVSYPPGTNSLEANKEISMVGDWTQFLRQVASDQKPCFMILQIAWSGTTKPGATLRFPTFPEERFMAYQAIINGARGAFFYGGNITAAMTPEDAVLGWNWSFWDKVLRPVVEEIGDYSPLAPALVAPDSGLPIVMTGAPDVEFCVRESGRYLFILACKREGATVNVQFSGLPDWCAAGELLFEAPRAVTATNGTFTDWFGPFEVHAYRFYNQFYADLNHSGSVDSADFQVFAACAAGPGVPPDGSAECQSADLDHDGDVDLDDFGLFQRCYSGDGVPSDPTCAD